VPVTYEIDKARNLIRTRCEGTVLLEDVVAHFHTLEKDPDCPEHLDVLLDLSGTLTLPTPAKLRVVSDEIGRVRSRVGFGNCAIVVDREALYGIARMFEVFASGRFHATQVFRDRTEAEAWLESPEKA
jgi:hypothetical protein